jgi:hypothetical protein
MKEAFYIPNNPEDKRLQAAEGWEDYQALKDLDYESHYSPEQLLELLKQTTLVEGFRETVWKDIRSIRPVDQPAIVKGLIEAGFAEDLIRYAELFQAADQTETVRGLLASSSAEECAANPELYPQADYLAIFSEYLLMVEGEEDDEGYVYDAYPSPLYYAVAQGFVKYPSAVQELLLTRYGELSSCPEFSFSFRGDGSATHQRVLGHIVQSGPSKVYDELEQGGNQPGDYAILARVGNAFCTQGQEQIVAEWLGRLFKDLNAQSSRSLVEAGHLRKVVEKAWCFSELDDLVSTKAGFDVTALLKVWERLGVSYMPSPDDERVFQEIVRTRGLTALDLEQRNPGIISYLYKQCGLTDFVRYPAELLERQYAERENLDCEWGLAMYARSDWNLALAQQQDALRELAQSTPEIVTRFVECRNGLDVARRFVSMTEQYGDFEYGVLSAHGSEESISLGVDNRVGTRLTVKEISGLLKNPYAKQKNRLSAEVPVAVLSCKGGVDGGVAETISKETGSFAVGGSMNANIRSLRVVEDDMGRRRFETRYTQGEAVSYAAGEVI